MTCCFQAEAGIAASDNDGLARKVRFGIRYGGELISEEGENEGHGAELENALSIIGILMVFYDSYSEIGSG